MKNLTKTLISLLLLGAFLTSASAKLKVASLNPILTDSLKEIGGDKVDVVNIMRTDVDVHTFQPRAEDLRKMQACSCIFAMGKGLETYLPAIQETLQPGQKLIEVGRSIPSQKVDADQIYTCCPHHDRNTIDPHWWHNVQNMERASKVVYKALSDLDPANADYYKERGEAARKNYRDLHNWVKGQVSQIPKKQRLLVTAHAAFAYFCKEYGFKAAFVQGLSKEGEISAKLLAETIKTIQEDNIKAVFPEVGANPKTLGQIAKESGATVGKPLYADHLHTSYKQMIEYNVGNIVKALR